MQTTMAVNRPYEDTRKALLEEEPLLAAAASKTLTLTQQIAAAQDELKTFGQDALRIARLEREADEVQTSYRKFLASLEQTRIDHDLETQRMSNISVAQPASLDPRPVAPQQPHEPGPGPAGGRVGRPGRGRGPRRPRHAGPHGPPRRTPEHRAETAAVVLGSVGLHRGPAPGPRHRHEVAVRAK